MKVMSMSLVSFCVFKSVLYIHVFQLSWITSLMVNRSWGNVGQSLFHVFVTCKQTKKKLVSFLCDSFSCYLIPLSLSFLSNTPPLLPFQQAHTFSSINPAPSISLQRYTGYEVEVWSLGVTLYTLMYWENPFYDVDEIIKGALNIPYEHSPGKASILQLPSLMLVLGGFVLCHLFFLLVTYRISQLSLSIFYMKYYLYIFV